MIRRGTRVFACEHARVGDREQDLHYYRCRPPFEVVGKGGRRVARVSWVCLCRDCHLAPGNPPDKASVLVAADRDIDPGPIRRRYEVNSP